jgi:MSHA pilin protein MshD
MSGRAQELYASNNMNAICHNRGLTLIEIVIAIVVIGLTVPVLTRNWFDVTRSSVRSETLYDAVSYGEQLMEEIKSKRFDEQLEPPWTPANLFGARRSNEGNEATRALYDDVDDYDGLNETLSSGLRGAVRVEYVNMTGSAWQTVAGDETDFKRVTVTVSRNTLLTNTTLSTIVGRY